MESKKIITAIDGPYQEPEGWRVVHGEIQNNGEEKRKSKFFKTQLEAVEYINKLRDGMIVQQEPPHTQPGQPPSGYRDNDWWLQICASLTARLMKCIQDMESPDKRTRDAASSRAVMAMRIARTVSSLAATSRGFVSNSQLESKLALIEKKQKTIEKARSTGAKLGLKSSS